jgi:hypothetical protein
MGTCDFQAPAEQKPLHRTLWDFANLIKSAIPPNLPKMAIIAWLGAAPYLHVKYSFKNLLMRLTNC